MTQSVNDKNEPTLSDFGTLHEVVNSMVRRGHVRLMAKRLGRAESSIYLWGSNPEDSRHGMPAAAIVPFTLASEDTTLIEWLADQTGGVFVALPDCPAALSVTGAEMAKLMKEIADVFSTWSKAIRDGRVTEKEKPRLAKALNQAVRQAVKLERSFR